MARRCRSRRPRRRAATSFAWPNRCRGRTPGAIRDSGTSNFDRDARDSRLAPRERHRRTPRRRMHGKSLRPSPLCRLHHPQDTSAAIGTPSLVTVRGVSELPTGIGVGVAADAGELLALGSRRRRNGGGAATAARREHHAARETEAHDPCTHRTRMQHTAAPARSYRHQHYKRSSPYVHGVRAGGARRVTDTYASTPLEQAQAAAFFDLSDMTAHKPQRLIPGRLREISEPDSGRYSRECFERR